MNAAGDVLIDGPYRAVVGPTTVKVSPLARNAAGEPATILTRGLTDESLAGTSTPRGAAGLSGSMHGSVSDDGETIGFESTEVLAPGATEGRRNAYVWHEGRVAYVAQSSTGLGGPTGVAVSADGSNLLLQSNEVLVPNASQDAPAIFDARIGGGFPPRPTPPAPCASALTCQGPATRIRPAPSPAAGPGSGNSPTPVLVLRRPDKADLGRAARTGTLLLRIEAGGGGTLEARASTTDSGRRRKVASASRATGPAAAETELRLHIDRAARSRLGEDGRLRLRVVVDLAGAGSRTANIQLRRGGGR